MSISIKRGKMVFPATPNRRIPVRRRTFDVPTDNETPAHVKNANRARHFPLEADAIRRGMINMAGIPTNIDKEAANPAFAGDIPAFSRIFGSQFLYPWLTAKDKIPNARITRMFRILMRLRNALLIPMPSVASTVLASLAKNHHKKATPNADNP
jgi:hypothetical protein